MSAFVDLDRRLAARGIAAAVYVVGGAAIALTIASRRVTVDVDALATHAVVYEEAALLAADQPGSDPRIPLRPSVEPPSRSGLQIDVAPPEHLLAMNLETVLGVRREEDLDAEVSARAEAVRRIIDHFAG